MPWNDASGTRLREWLGVTSEIFYDKKKIAILPMGFCYPGKGLRGDLPPRPDCYPLWHKEVLKKMPNIELTILLGHYAQNAYLQNFPKRSLTETVRNWKQYLPQFLPLPHPSPLNNLWLAKNKWFERDLKEIRRIVYQFL